MIPADISIHIYVPVSPHAIEKLHKCKGQVDQEKEEEISCGRVRQDGPITG